MRVHLVIFRHNLPPMRILWTTPPSLPVSDHASAATSFTIGALHPTVPSAVRAASVATNYSTAQTSIAGHSVGGGPPPTLGGAGSGYTISQLLQDVNEVVPLETQPDSASNENAEIGQWALEDYVVEVLGSECLHFLDVNALLRDGDEVVIRPLQIEDLAARQITGRHQIASNGAHLIDGVPFGRQFEKRGMPMRPPIVIPPRKRRKYDCGNVEEDGSVASVAYNMERPGRSESRRESLRLNSVLQRGEEADDAPPSAQRNFPGQDIYRIPSAEIHHPPKHEVEIHPVTVASCSPSSASASPDEGESESEEESSVGSEDESADADSDPGDSSSSSGSSDASSGDASSSLGDGVEDKPKKPTFSNQNKGTTKPLKVNPPGQGRRATRNSNIRTKLRRRLERLKALSLLHKDANFADLRAWDEAQAGQKKDFSKVPVPGGDNGAKFERELDSEFEKKRAQLLRDIAAGGVDVKPSPLTEKVQQSITSAQNDQVDASSQQSNKDAVSHAVTPVQEGSPPSNSKRQNKLDLAGTRRLLFGSLGVRTPKTKEDEDRTRKLLASKGQKARIIKPETQELQSGVDTEASHLKPVENWQNVLILKATECIYDNVQLSEPPFPFVQRWNAQDQKAIRECRWKNNSKKGKKRKRESQSYYDDTLEDDEYDESNDYTNGDIILDYGEDENRVLAKSSSPQLQQVESDDLPPLPTDVSSLAFAEESDLEVGAVITFKQLDLSKETSWEPIVSNYKTAVVQEVLEDSGFLVCLAKRDRESRPVQNDEEDNVRIYSKFEMPGYDEDEEGEDDGIRKVTYNDLIEPKLLRPPTEPAPAPATAPIIGTDGPPGASQIPESIIQAKEGIESTPISLQTRNEIATIIREAGFRSALNSDLLGPEDELIISETCPVRDANQAIHSDAGTKEATPVILSPRFEGFEGFEASPAPRISRVSYEDNNSEHAGSPRHATSDVKELSGVDSLGNTASSQIAAQHLTVASDDGLNYLTEPDMTLGLRSGVNSQSIEVVIPPPSSQPLLSEQDSFSQEVGSQELQHTEEDSQPAALRPGSNASSTVTNPFFAQDQKDEETAFDGGLSLDKVIPSTAPALMSTSSSKTSLPRRNRLRYGKQSTARVRSISKEVAEDEALDYPDSPSSQAKSSPLKEPKISASQIPENAWLVDLTISSEPASPQNSDGDYATSQGLPSGPGWVQKKKTRNKRTRSVANDDAVRETRPRVKTRKSVI